MKQIIVCLEQTIETKDYGLPAVICVRKSSSFTLFFFIQIPPLLAFGRPTLFPYKMRLEIDMNIFTVVC